MCTNLILSIESNSVVRLNVDLMGLGGRENRWLLFDGYRVLILPGAKSPRADCTESQSSMLLSYTLLKYIKIVHLSHTYFITIFF